MDENSDVFDSFESVLKQQSTSKPSTLYKNAINRNTSHTTHNQKPSAQSVISHVASQIKAIQNSEVVRSNKRPVIDMNKYRNTSFLPLNKLQDRVPPHLPEQQKFDTQHFSNTQLINIVEDAEALDVNMGMTQEFETTFMYSQEVTDLDHKQNSEQKNLVFPILDISLKEPDPNPILLTSSNNNRADKISDDSIEPYKNVDLPAEQTLTDVETQSNQAVNEYEDIDYLDAINKDTENLDNSQAHLSQQNCIQRPPSPVFNVKSKKAVSDTESPLVFDLELFENFENMAMPIVQMTPDFEEAKFLINSQIIGNELVIHTYMDDTEPLSPIIEINDDLLHINKESITQTFIEWSCKESKVSQKRNIRSKSKESCQSDKSAFQDEILFSSDEEEAYHQRSYKDLPFTCALETSFYEQSKVLDKTMYVGFQTASNKSIQIGTELFCKARSLFDSIEHDLNNEGTLTELVEMCDMRSSGTTEVNIAANIVNAIPTNDNVAALQIKNKSNDSSLSTRIPYYDNNSIKNLLEDENALLDNTVTCSETQFEGFKTASNKPIQLSEEALSKSKKILQSINFDSSILSKDVALLEDVVKHDKKDKSIDDDIIKEFQEDLANAELEEIMKDVESDEDWIVKNDKIIDDEQNIGFKTASNKNIHISDAAIAKGKQLFQDINMDDKPDNTGKLLNTDVKTIHNIGFRTASNKEITISEQAQIQTKHLFNSLDLNDDYIDSNQSNIKKINITNHQPTTSKTSHIEFLEKEETNEPTLVKSNIADHNTELTHFGTVDDKNIFVSPDSTNIKNININEDIESPFLGFDKNEKYAAMVEETLEKSQKILEKLTQYDKINVNDSDMSNTQLVPNIFCNFSHPDKNQNKKFKNASAFRTASNKEVKISEVALEKSRKMFQDIDEDKSLKIITESVRSTSSNLKFQGFHTASNKDIKISESALAKSKQIFQDLRDSKYTYVNANNVNQNTNFHGFQTASHKEVIISEEALAKSKKIFHDTNDDASANMSGKVGKNSKFEGFQTASNKPISISEKALAKSRKLFQDISGEKLLENTIVNDSSSIREIVKEDLKFKGFHTANNKKINISEKALVSSRKLFEDIVGINLVETGSNNLHTKARQNAHDSTFESFETANNKEVGISQIALEKSNEIFKDVADDKSDTTNSLCAKTTTSFIFQGFKTASNKEVQISAEALAKSKKMFQDINDDVNVESNPVLNTINKDLSTPFQGFQTANNKEVPISIEALEKSKKIFQDINDDKLKEADSGVSTISTFKGFQTANNKDVKVSEEAMAKSKKLFHDLDYVNVGSKNNEPNLERTNLNFRGFQTANNKNVKISDEAIAKSKKIFQDLDTDPKTEAFISEMSEIACHSDIKDAGSKIESYNKRNILPGDDLTKCKKIFIENIAADIKMQTEDKQHLKVSKKCTENVNDIDTQLLNNFEESMHEVTPKKSKRSGSPILSCPKAKKRKIFQIPYSQKSPKKESDTFKPPDIVKKSENMYNFSVSYKKLKMLHLKDLQRLEDTTEGKIIIDPYILKFDYENLLEFEFTDSRNDVNKSVLTMLEIMKIFLNSVNKKIVPEGWLEIQLKLILWKLISYEIKFPKTMQLTCTAKNLLEQLKYRYDKELYNAERPALRKIFERDDTAAKTLVLCVVAVCDVQDVSQPPELLLTDGWYVIRAVIDKMLAKKVGSGRITVGTKLVINGAELVGSEQAVSPWEDTSLIRLKIFGNSTRRARWDSRLGYHGNAAILSQLSTASMDGGKVSKLRVFVTRVYPPLYVDKFEDGSTVTRSERLEHLHQMKFESERQAMMEKIYEDVEKEVSDQNTQGSDEVMESSSKRKCLDSGSQIAKIMRKSRDPNEFQSHLTSTQTALLQDHTSKEREKLLQEIQTRVQNKMAALGVTLTRNVVTLFKVRVAGVDVRRGGVEVTRALLSIWRPNEAVIELIKEGSWIEILNVVPTALRYSELHISAGRQSIFSQLKYKESEKLKPFTESLKRTCYPIKDLVKNPSMTTEYNEIDTVGMIFEIDPAMNNFDLNKHQFQNVFLADADKNIISVNFWGGLKKFGFENVLDTGQIVAGTNLQKRAGNTRKNIPQYRVTEFSYFTKTPKSETARKYIEELEQKLFKIDKNVFCKECSSLKNNYFAKQKTNENVTPYRFPNMDINLTKNKIFIDSPLVQNSHKKDENLNLTGLDFDSTFKEAHPQDLSPKTLLRKRQVQERIAKLKRYGEPPPLSPMQIINKSKNAANAFKSPLIPKSDVSPSVAINEKNLPNKEKCADVPDVAIQCSPVINLNRTYVKRSNPVKLNFSKNENSLSEAIDEFAEEFDCSPPLSLD